MSEVASNETSVEGMFLVIKVRVPKGWKPKSIDDLPPGVERVELPTPAAAAAFLRMFNERELQSPSGLWAVG